MIYSLVKKTKQERHLQKIVKENEMLNNICKILILMEMNLLR